MSDAESDKQDGAKGAEFMIETYEAMVKGLSLEHIQAIERMALTEEGVEKWPDEQRFRLIRMFEEAVLMAENAELGLSHPARTTKVH